MKRRDIEEKIDEIIDAVLYTIECNCGNDNCEPHISVYVYPEPDKWGLHPDIKNNPEYVGKSVGFVLREKIKKIIMR